MPVSAKAEMARVRWGLVGEGDFLPGMRVPDQNAGGRSARSEERGVRKGSLSKTVPLKTSLAKLWRLGGTAGRGMVIGELRSEETYIYCGESILDDSVRLLKRSV